MNTNHNGDSMSAVVCVSPPNLRADAAMAAQILRMRPSLAEHACKSDGLGRFGDKIVGSTLPHLVEHLAIDLLVEWTQAQVRAQVCQKIRPHDTQPVSGNTKWLDKERGLMRVSIHAAAESPDNVAQAISQAVALVNRLAAHLSD